ncbi:MAG: acyl-CoA reductase, partial [Chitinophagaceae bacterium]
MNLQRRISLMSRLGEYMQSEEEAWQQAKARAYNKNGWFTPEFIEQACNAIANSFLKEDKLAQWAGAYQIADSPAVQKNVGIVMAGNIPLVGFHDFLAVFINGHKQTIKLSGKDDVLLPHLISKLAQWDPAVSNMVHVQEVLKGCDAYIATGSNNSSRYFEQYFGKYPNIIRKNRNSVAVITGEE